MLQRGSGAALCDVTMDTKWFCPQSFPLRATIESLLQEAVKGGLLFCCPLLTTDVQSCFTRVRHEKPRP